MDTKSTLEFIFGRLGIWLILFAIAAIAGIIIAIVAASKKKKAMPQSNTANGSYFDGGTFAYLGWSILAWLLTVCTLGIAMPWAECMLLRWETKHTVIDGRRLAFDGTGGQLFVRYILWWFLSLITFGIYTFWATVNVLKWETNHTYAEGTNDRNSFFDGTGGGYLGYKILFTLMTVFSLGIAYPWAVKMMLVWMKEHTVVSSRRFVYTGKGSQLLGHYLLWTLLSIITFGIYGLFVPVRVQKLIVGNTHSGAPATGYMPNGYAPVGYAPMGYAQSSYRETIKNDATRYTLAETNRQLKMMKLGLTEDTPFDKLYPMVQQNIPEAQYILAMQHKIKDENDKTEQIIDLLKKSADAGFAPSQYEYSDSLVSDPAKVTDALVEESIEYFMKSAKDGFLPAEEQWMHFCLDTGVDEASEGRNADDTLQLGVYWHDIVVERGGEISEEDTILYNAAVEILRINGIFCGVSPFAGNVPVYSAQPAPVYAPVPPKKSNAGKIIGIICGVIGGVVILNIIGGLLITYIISRNQRPEETGIYEEHQHIILEGEWKAVHYNYLADTLFIFQSDGSYCYYRFYDGYNDINNADGISYYEEGTYLTTENHIEFTRTAENHNNSGITEVSSFYSYVCEYYDNKIEIGGLITNNASYSSDEQNQVEYIEKISGSYAVNEADEDASGNQYDVDFAMELIQGDWYYKNENNDFWIFKIDGNNIRKSSYYTEKTIEDDQSVNNIYFDGEIYSIVGGGTRSGSFIFTQIGDMDFRLDITFPADPQYGEESYSTIIIEINPDNPTCFTIVEDNNASVNIDCIRGDIEELRIY